MELLQCIQCMQWFLMIYTNCGFLVDIVATEVHRASLPHTFPRGGNVQEKGETLWTPKQVAEFLHVSKSWLSPQVMLGKLEAVAISGSKRKVKRFDPAYIKAKFSARSDGNGKSE